MKPITSFWERARKWGTPILISVSTYLLMDKLNTMLDVLKLVPGIELKIGLHDAHLTAIDANYNEFRGEYKELEKLVGTKEDRIDLPKPKK